MRDVKLKKVSCIMRHVSAGVLCFTLFSILWVNNSYAVFENLTSTGWEIFGGMRQIIFGAAGFGIIAIAIGSFFGVLNWKWLSAIIIGLVVIGLTVSLVKYLVQGTGADVSISGISDTLINASD